MSEAPSAIHPRIPPKDTADTPTAVFAARGQGQGPTGIQARGASASDGRLGTE